MKSFLPLLIALSFIGGPAFAHSATEPVPRGDDGWKRRNEAIIQRVNEIGAQSQVLFIGDSITQGWEGAGKDVWARHYNHRKALNLGIGGDRTQHVLWRLENGNLKGVKPKAAVVMIGTNNSNGEDNSIEQIADGVAAIVAKLRTTLPDATVLLIPIFPRGENPNPQRGKILQVNQILQKLADDPKVVWVDFGHRLIDSRGTIPANLMPDFLHLSPAAYAIWAESLEPHLARALGDAPVTSTTAVSLTGQWVLTIPGFNDEPVDLPMTLQQDGNRLTGTVARGQEGTLNISEGRVDGTRFSWVIQRERPNGGRMTYKMSGTVEGEKLKGRTETEFNGNAMANDWSARRK
jgi:lysophospholipase L1-like esterase